jgi:hypothetical protein
MSGSNRSALVQEVSILKSVTWEHMAIWDWGKFFTNMSSVKYQWLNICCLGQLQIYEERQRGIFPTRQLCETTQSYSTNCHNYTQESAWSNKSGIVHALRNLSPNYNLSDWRLQSGHLTKGIHMTYKSIKRGSPSLNICEMQIESPQQGKL